MKDEGKAWLGRTGYVLSTRHGDIERLELLLPSREEQAAIATILSDMDVAIDALEAKLAKARRLKQGMMQELLTERIRLV